MILPRGDYRLLLRIEEGVAGSARPGRLGAAIWGLGMGVHESIIPAAVSRCYRPVAELLHSARLPPVMASSGFLAVR